MTTIPIRRIWVMRYRAYRHKYGRWAAFWRGVVWGEVAFRVKTVMDDDLELMEHLVSVKLVGATLHVDGKEYPLEVEEVNLDETPWPRI